MKRFNRTYNDTQACVPYRHSAVLSMRIKHSQSQSTHTGIAMDCVGRRRRRRVKTLCKKETVKWQHLYVIIITFYRVYSRPYMHIQDIIQHPWLSQMTFHLSLSLSLTSILHTGKKNFFLKLFKLPQNIACMQVTDGKWENIFFFVLKPHTLCVQHIIFLSCMR